jgi:hypothetical protein
MPVSAKGEAGVDGEEDAEEGNEDAEPGEEGVVVETREGMGAMVEDEEEAGGEGEGVLETLEAGFEGARAVGERGGG